MICPKCGNEIKEGMVFCSKCGNRVTEGVNSQHLESDNLKSIKNRVIEYRKYIIIAVSVLVVFLVIRFFTTGKSTTSYEDVVNKYIDSMKKCDVQGVLDCLPESERTNADTIDLVTRELVGNGNQIGIINSPYEVFYKMSSPEEMTQDELESFSRDGEKIKKGYRIAVNVTQNLDGITIAGIPVNGAIVKSSDYNMYVGLIGRKWYVLRYMEFTYYT